ncbi:MAG: WYL domain-containing protein, partial [Planctomycetes bacterium]|nr:WYL domain-containing protein [Planctomycetota bacterium]
EKPATFSLVKHTYGAFGIFGPGKFQTIRARFTGWAAINVREHRWHQSQKIVSDTKKGLTAEFELSNTVEFKRWVLGFGRHAVVVKPRKLAKDIAEELTAARISYR